MRILKHSGLFYVRNVIILQPVILIIRTLKLKNINGNIKCSEH